MSVVRAEPAAATDNQASRLIAELREIVGNEHTLTDAGATRRYRTIEIQADDHTITAADPLPADLTGAPQPHPPPRRYAPT